MRSVTVLLGLLTTAPKDSRRTIAPRAGWARRVFGLPRSYPARAGRSAACPPGAALPASSARGRSSSVTGSPSSLTPPCAISRRASEVDATPSDETSSAGRCTGSPSGSETSSTSSGASRWRTTRVKCASAVLGGRLAVRARHDPPRESELRRHRLAGGRVGLLGDEPPPVGEHLVGDPHRPAEHLLRRRGQRDVVADRRAHLLAVPRKQERGRQHDLRLEAVLRHHLAAGEQVVELVGAAELDVGLDRHRVVGLHQRIEQLRDRDRLVRRPSAWRSRRARGAARP